MDYPLVSAVIVTYKRETEIVCRAVRSVLLQAYSNIEVLVVNDAPEEKELENKIKNMLNSLGDNRVKYIVHEKNKGANAARNTGLYNAKGEYIAFLDDDDEWEKEKILMQVKAIQEDDGIALVYGKFINVFGQEEKEYSPPDRSGQPLEYILEENFIGGTSFPLLCTEKVKSVGGFDESLKSCQEYDLWIRLIKNYRIRYINRVLGKYYMSTDSTFKKTGKYVEGIEAVINKHIELYTYFCRAYSNRLLNMWFSLFRERAYVKSLSYKIKALKADWSNPQNLAVVYLFIRIARHYKK